MERAIQQLSNPFSAPAVKAFCERIGNLIVEDLKMGTSEAADFVEYSYHLLLDKQRAAFTEIAIYLKKRSIHATSPDLDGLLGLNSYLKERSIRARWNRVLAEQRSASLADWIKPHVLGNMLDLLCGDGKIGRKLRNQKVDVKFTERVGVYDNESALRKLPYTPLHKLERLSLSPRFDTVLLSTVLHHEDSPDALLDLAAKYATRRIIIIENCIDSSCDSDGHLLMDMFFNECLNQTRLKSVGNHKVAEFWVATLKRYGRICHHETRVSLPGIPLSHDLMIVDLR